MGPQVLEPWEGSPTSGTIAPGDPPTTVLLGPMAWVTEEPGVVTTSWPFIDATYAGEPPFAEKREVYVDHCREVFEDLTLPHTFTLGPFGDDETRTLTVSPTGGTIIEDVDVIAELTVSDCTGHGGAQGSCRYSARLASPDPGGIEVMLKDLMDLPQIVYDEDTDRGAAGNLDNFNGKLSDGSWVLTLQNDPAAEEPLVITLHDFHVRLHHQDALPCE